jgi:hypothetical protein
MKRACRCPHRRSACPGSRFPAMVSLPPPRDLPGLFARVASLLPERGRFYLQTMVFGPNMIPLNQIGLNAPNSVCFERQLLDHFRLVFEKEA